MRSGKTSFPVHAAFRDERTEVGGEGDARLLQPVACHGAQSHDDEQGIGGVGILLKLLFVPADVLLVTGWQ